MRMGTRERSGSRNERSSSRNESRPEHRRGSRDSRKSSRSMRSTRSGDTNASRRSGSGRKEGGRYGQAKASDKFLVGLIGATLMITQVLVGISVLTAWLRVENSEMKAALGKYGL
eukprot:TRINITY_DN103289_c0_g1_i1.p1 TRINITY_DN103289_c0_g1~~TRINITY_DN103289_c0_g1_i1.p1  ORF type:complete len:115 (+),score=13.51 TRINITY_DN103289_c0_g1_i1:204-548(+)